MRTANNNQMERNGMANFDEDIKKITEEVLQDGTVDNIIRKAVRIGKERPGGKGQTMYFVEYWVEGDDTNAGTGN